jgi:hypothetical protein
MSLDRSQFERYNYLDSKFESEDGLSEDEFREYDELDRLFEQDDEGPTVQVAKPIAAPQQQPLVGPQPASEDYKAKEELVRRTMANQPPVITPSQSLASSAADWQRRQESGTLSQGSDPSDWAHKAMAFSAHSIPGYTALAQGAQQLSGALGFKSLSPGEVQMEISRAAEENPGAGMLGGIAQGVALAPVAGMNALAKGAKLVPAMKAGAGLAGAQYLTQKMNVDPDAVEALTELPVHMAGGALFGGAAEKLIPTSNPLVAPVAKRAAKGVRDWADTYARQTLGIDPQEIMTLQNPSISPSQKGLGSRWDDILEELTTHIIPEGPMNAGTMSPIELRAAALKNMQVGQDVAEASRLPTRILVDNPQLAREFEDAALGLESRNVMSGRDAANILRSESQSLMGQQPANPVGQPSWTNQTNLGELERIATAIRRDQYPGALKASDPQEATRLAAEQLHSLRAHSAARQTGLDPMEQLANEQAANSVYEAKRKAAEIVFGVEGKKNLPPSVGLISSPSSALPTQVTRGFTDVAKERGARMVLGASKKALSWATKKLNEKMARVGNAPGAPTRLIDKEVSPFQLDAFRRQVDALDRMDPGDFSVALYAMSTTDPIFNALWKLSQGDEEEESVMQAEANRTDQ